MAKYISNDLIAEILCLLPVKSLLRFESVSKSWYSLIHDPLFIKSHLRVSTKTNSNSVLVGHAKYSDLCLAGLRSPHDFVKVDLPPPLKDSYPWKYELIKVRGSDNGLICLTLLDRYLILSNMATKDYHITSIPSPPAYKRKRTRSRFFYGFGYDSLNDDYKVVIFVRCTYRDDVYAETTIYSLRHNAWSKSRRAEVSQRKLFPRICSFDSSLDAPNGVVASSALHWLAGSYPYNDTLSSSFILAFDLASEQFHQMLLPDHVRKQQEIQIRVKRERFVEFTRVGVLGRCLCVSSRDCFESPFFDIWVMKDYKIHGSWTKLCRIMLHDKTVSSLIPILAYNPNNLMLLEIYRSFYCCNIQKRRLNYLPNFYHGLHRTVICLGTLVSISAYRALWKKGNRARGRKRSRESRDDVNVQSQFDAREQAEVNEALMYFFIFQKKFNWIQSKV